MGATRLLGFSGGVSLLQVVGTVKILALLSTLRYEKWGYQMKVCGWIYVKAICNQFHMVVANYATPASMPVILDNLDPTIKPANLRTDLIPIYSFNGSHLWLMKAKGQGQLAGNSDRLSLWTDLQKRFNTQHMNRPILNLDN